MPKQRSIAEARKNLPQLVREVEAGEEIELTRRGIRVAVLLGREQFERLEPKRKRFSEAWKAFTDKVDLAAMNIDPDELLEGVRDRSSGRDPDF